MKRKILLFTLLFAFIINIQSQTVNVLFLGNSFTANTQLNTTVKEMVNAGSSGVTVNLNTSVILYGQNLDAHWKNTASRNEIQSGNYDYIVFQGYMNNGNLSMGDTLLKYGALLIAEADAAGATSLIFSHQANCNSERENWDNIESYNRTLATNTGATFCPAGIAWLQAKTMIADLDLHDPDCHHQNDISSYINACVFYYMITGESPVGNPHRTSNSTTIDADIALLLQEAADSVVKAQTGTSVSGVAVSPSSVSSLPVDSTIQLTTEISPTDATNKSVLWTSNNNDVATVDIHGVVTGVNMGTAIITANTIDGSFNATSEITVTGSYIPATNGTAFRYLRLQIDEINGSDIYVYEVEWMEGATAHPTTKATSTSNSNITASNQIPWCQSWKAFDGDNSVSNMWVPSEDAYPCMLTIDLGSGNEIEPTAINISSDQFHSIAGFTCLGSNDNSTWYHLFDSVGIESSDWTSGVYNTYSFPSQLTDTEAPTVPSDLAAANVTKTSFDLSWTESTDNLSEEGQIQYVVFKDGSALDTTFSTSMSIVDLSPSTTYSMTVKAMDAAIPQNISALSSALIVSTRSADTIFTDGDFITLSELGGVFTAGMNTQEFFHTQMGANYAAKTATEGNPDNAISMGVDGCQVLLSLDAPESSETWKIEFDQITSGTISSGPFFSVYGLQNDETIPYAEGGGTGGSALLPKTISGTETAWTHKTFYVSVSDAFDAIVLEWFINGDGMMIDNVLITKSSVTTYSLTVNNGSGDGDYAESTVVSITADAPSTGQVFDAWTGDVANVDDVSAASTNITMPAAATMVTATYVDLTYTITFNVDTNGTALEDAAVSFNSETINTDASGQAVFNNVVYGTSLAYSIVKSGFNTETGTVDATSDATENVTMTLTPANTFTVTFTVNDGTDPIQGANVNFNSQDVLTNTSGEAIFAGVSNGTDLPYSVSMTGYNTESGTVDVASAHVDETITLNLTPATYTVSVTNGTGSGDYVEGVTVNIAADAAPSGQEFSHWSGDNQFLNDSTLASAKLSMPAVSVSLTAEYRDILNNTSQYNINLSIYPNPANDFIKIRSSQIIKSLKIINIAGKLACKKDVNAAELKMDISYLGPGVYLLEVKLNNMINHIEMLIVE